MFVLLLFHADSTIQMHSISSAQSPSFLLAPEEKTEPVSF